VGKYWRLTEYLDNLDSDSVTLTFDELGRILGFKLPDSASNYDAWWHGGGTHTHTRAWEDAGWSVRADRNNRRATFRKSSERSPVGTKSVPSAPTASVSSLASRAHSTASEACAIEGDFASSLILIPCSDRKRPGGEPMWRNELTAPSALGPRGEWLWEARKAISSMLALTPGPDLGLDSAQHAYLPALERYDGLLYRGAHFGLWGHEDLEVVRQQCLIVSALYGLVTPTEFIRNYNVSMKTRLIDGSLAKRWWRRRGLGDTLKAYIAAQGITDIFCFLSNDYVEATGNLDFGPVRLHRFPCSQGTGSLSVQGQALARLVQQRACGCEGCVRDSVEESLQSVAQVLTEAPQYEVAYLDFDVPPEPTRHSTRTIEVEDRASRESSSPNDPVAAALQALDENPVVIKASDWPHGLDDLGSPGLYSWWVDTPGACELSAGLRLPLYPGRIYAGQTGAGTSSSTLRSRIGGNHLRGSIEGSTFRLTLAAILEEQLSLEVTGRRKLSSDSEKSICAWMAKHLSVAVYPFPDREALGDLEAHVVCLLDPPLNLEHCDKSTPLRIRLSQVRGHLAM
jgi:hypothetical protein